MKFTEFVSVDAITVRLKASGKREAIAELVDLLVASKAVEPSMREQVVEAIWQREQLGSTGIGRGIAVPHTRLEGIARVAGAVGVTADGLDFNSLDGEKVHILFMLVSPTQRSDDHRLALGRIAQSLRDSMFCRFLRQSNTPEEAFHLLSEADTNP